MVQKQLERSDFDKSEIASPVDTGQITTSSGVLIASSC